MTKLYLIILCYATCYGEKYPHHCVYNQYKEKHQNNVIKLLTEDHYSDIIQLKRRKRGVYND